ncbi:hypothetical protein R1sor_001215 [Riccia sorocarpa]|uniref:Uncharacterized protein n=1 Tax=Riccia sorocarpa TaxID=122646 RepID=A0ABD3GVD0_9MARC
MTPTRRCNRWGRFGLSLSEFKRLQEGSRTSVLRLHTQHNCCVAVRRLREERVRDLGEAQHIPSGGFNDSSEQGAKANVVAVRCSSIAISHELEDLIKTKSVMQSGGNTHRTAREADLERDNMYAAVVDYMESLAEIGIRWHAVYCLLTDQD